MQAVGPLQSKPYHIHNQSLVTHFHLTYGDISMPHLVDKSGYPQDPVLRQLEFQLGDLAERWRGSYGDDEQQRHIIEMYHAILSKLYQQGWDAVLDVESELPDELMPDEYLRRNGRFKHSDESISLVDTGIIFIARNAARNGQLPHQIVALIRDRMNARFGGSRSIVAIEACICQAFEIPLREVRDVERWIGLFPTGDWTDLELDDYLAPWFTKWSSV
jgi:hypothetical protein